MVVRRIRIADTGVRFPYGPQSDGTFNLRIAEETLGLVAQLVERFYGIEEVAGPNPVESTKHALRNIFYVRLKNSYAQKNQPNKKEDPS